LLFNERDEILVGRRIDHKNRLYAAPGGNFEFGETFEECAARELHEELNLQIPLEQFKYLTTLNVIHKEENFHYVNIMMVAVISDEQSSTITNHDVEVCLEWEWIPFAEFVKKKDVYHTFTYLNEQGFNNIEAIYSKAGIVKSE
jgi:8-oxo-dGTP diphosphatase